MSSLSGHIRQSIALIITIAIVLLALCMYFFVYVANKETHVNERNFRILSRTTRNLTAKIDEYASKHILTNIISAALQQQESSENKKDYSDHESFKKFLQRETKGFIIEALSASTLNASKKNQSLDTTVWKVPGESNIRFRDVFTKTFSLKSAKKLRKIIPLSDKLPGTKDVNLLIDFRASTSIADFISPVLRTDIFSNYIIIEYDNVHRRYDVIYATNHLGVADSVSREILKNQNTVATVELNGVTYLSFNYPLTFAGKHMVLAALQRQEDYRVETRSLDRPLLYTLLLILMMLLLALPMIKIVFISKHEKLNKVDIVLCSLSLLMGCSFCTFIIISNDDNHLYDHGELDSLAIQIEREFSTEIRQMYNTVAAADDSMRSVKDDKVVQRNFAHYVCQRLCPNCKSDSVCSPSADSIGIIIHWTDPYGMQRYKWTNNKLTYKVDVSDRGYFRNFRERKAWIYPFTDDSSRTQKDEYVVESIFSWTELEKKAVVSKRSIFDSAEVVGLTKKLRSVIEPIVPPGFKFCLADQQGNVWFHSDVRRNLNENIFEEIPLGGDLSDLLYESGKRKIYTYENKEHVLRIDLMKNFPLYLITMRDLSLQQQSQAYTQELTFTLLCLEFLMILVAIGLIKLSHQSAIKRLSVDWLKPDQSKSESYLKIASLSFVIIILFLLLVYLGVLDEAEQLFFLLTVPLFTLPLFFRSLNIPAYRNYYSKPSYLIHVVVILSILIMDALFFIAVKFPWASIGLQLVFFISERLFLRKVLVSKGRLYECLHNECRVLYFYTAAIALVLTSISILPTVIFFWHSFNNERKINAMVTQYEFAKQLYAPDAARREFLPKEYLLKQQSSQETDRTFRPLEENVYFTRFSSFATNVTTMQPLKLLKSAPLDLGRFQTYIGNRIWTWKIKDRTLLFMPREPDPYKQVTGVTFEWHPFDLWSAIAVLTGSLASVYLLWLIYLLCSRVFLFRANQNLIDADMDLLRKRIEPVLIPVTPPQINTEIDAGLWTKSLRKENTVSPYTMLNHLLLIGLPFSGKQVYLEELVPNDLTKRYNVDLVRFAKYKIGKIAEEVESYQVIIIDHFEYDLENLQFNLLKLELLETLFSIADKKVVVLSTVHPAKLFEVCPEMEPKLKTRWLAVLSRFYKIFCPLVLNLKMNYQASEKSTIAQIEKNRRGYHEFIERECNHGLYLCNLKITLYNLVAQNEKITIAELVVKIRSLAYNYYASIWNCCTQEEQYLIYDLAEDGVVNSKNAELITQLVYKGIFVRENSLSIMNASFRDFVLSYVNSQDAIILRDKVSKNGNWRKMRISLFFVLAVVALFLLYSQKGLSNQVMGFITALAATLPLLLRMLEALSIGAAKKS